MEAKKPKVSVVMIDGSFRESYHSVDFFCRQSLAPVDYELIWVEFYDRVNPDLEKRIAQYPNARIHKLGNKDVIYHSSHCFNAGIKESKGEIIFIPDADVAVEEYFLEEAVKEHDANHKLVMYFHRKEELEDDHKKNITMAHLKKFCKFQNPANYGGCLSVRKKWLLEINGYEQHPVFGSGFHANGIDVYTRFKNLGLQVMWHPELILYHPWHPFNAAGFPVWEVQKTITRYRERFLLTSAYQGIDAGKNQELPEKLEQQLHNVKKQYKLDTVFDNWYNLKIDPGSVKEELFTRPFHTNNKNKNTGKEKKDEQIKKNNPQQNQEPIQKKIPLFSKLVGKFKN